MMSLFFLSFSTEALLLRNIYLLAHFVTPVMLKHTMKGTLETPVYDTTGGL